MRIVVQLKPAAAQQARTGGARKALAWLDRALTPIHAGTSDPVLSSFFEVDGGNSAEAVRLIDRLLKDPSVDAAYVKPDDELPSM